MFPRSAVHVMNAYVDNVCICEYENNTPKENVPPPLPLPYPKIYPIIFPGIINYAITFHFFFFLNAVHAYKSQFLNIIRINIEALFILYDPLHLF